MKKAAPTRVKTDTDRGTGLSPCYFGPRRSLRSSASSSPTRSAMNRSFTRREALRLSAAAGGSAWASGAARPLRLRPAANPRSRRSSPSCASVARLQHSRKLLRAVPVQRPAGRSGRATSSRSTPTSFPTSDMAREASQAVQGSALQDDRRGPVLGGSELAVDAVLLIGEHGDYPYNELGPAPVSAQAVLRPDRRRDARGRRFVPLFNDKHLSYRWDWAKEMYDTAREAAHPADGRQLGAAGASGGRRWSCRPGRRSKRPCPSTAAASRSTTFTAWRSCSRWSRPAAAARRASRRVELLDGDAL